MDCQLGQIRWAAPASTYRWLRAAARSIWRRKDLQAWQLQLSTEPMASTSSWPARPQPQWNHLRRCKCEGGLEVGMHARHAVVHGVA